MPATHRQECTKPAVLQAAVVWSFKFGVDSPARFGEVMLMKGVACAEMLQLLAAQAAAGRERAQQHLSELVSSNATKSHRTSAEEQEVGNQALVQEIVK